MVWLGRTIGGNKRITDLKEFTFICAKQRCIRPSYFLFCQSWRSLTITILALRYTNAKVDIVCQKYFAQYSSSYSFCRSPVKVSNEWLCGHLINCFLSPFMHLMAVVSYLFICKQPSSWTRMRGNLTCFLLTDNERACLKMRIATFEFLALVFIRISACVRNGWSEAAIAHIKKSFCSLW